MKAVKKELTMWQYMCYMSFTIIVLCWVIFMLSSCTESVFEVENEKPGSGITTGKDGNLKFAITFDRYGEGEKNALRSVAGLETETVVIPLNDGTSMVATLEPVTSERVNIRSAALRSFTDNTSIYLVAYRKNGGTYTYEQQVKYRIAVVGAASNLIHDDATVFSLSDGGVYKFVAYSYNNAVTPLPAISAMTNIDNSLDLIWGVSVADVTISSGVNEVEIHMSHLFAKVQLSALCSIEDIDDIQGVKMQGYTADLDVEKGITTAKTSGLMPFNGFLPLHSDSVASTRIVYTAEANTTVVTIDKVTFHSGKTFSNLTATFAKQLRSGYEYNLKMNFRKSVLVINPASIWLSPTTPSKTVQVTSTGTWSVVTNPANATLSAYSGNAGTDIPVTVTRNTTFGLSQFTVRNTVSGEEEVVTVDNFYIPKDEFVLPNNKPTGNTGEYEVIIYGGSEKFIIVNKPSWITSATILPNGKLQLVANQSPSQNLRTGKITLAHADDPTYEVEFDVIQDYNSIPPFDYFEIKFDWLRGDADIAVEFTENDAPFDNPYNTGNATYNSNNTKAVGFNLAESIDINGNAYNRKSISVNTKFTTQQLADRLLFWGGDARYGEGETVFFNAPQITPENPRYDNSGLMRYIRLEAYIAWFVFPEIQSDRRMTLTISTYEGGIMMKPEDNIDEQGLFKTNFYNVNTGTSSLTLKSQLRAPVFKEVKSFTNNDAPYGEYTNAWLFRKYYRLICVIDYDRYRRSARIWWGL